MRQLSVLKLFLFFSLSAVVPYTAALADEGALNPDNVEPTIDNTPLVIPRGHNTDMPTLAPKTQVTGKNNFIDTNNYEAPKVIVTERRNGCQTIANGGRLVGGSCSLTPPKPAETVARVPKTLSPNRIAVRQENTIVRRRTPVIANTYVRRSAPVLVASNGPVRLQAPAVIPNNVVALNPPEWNGVKLALAPVAPVNGQNPAVYDRATTLNDRPADAPTRTDMLFPLAIPAPITSAFGWRQHPITGNRTVHAGTDIGAPVGTPVLATYAGEVSLADWVGGYGLMVILRHLDGTQESRYAHLSEITVKPGQRVERGEMIGRVGSTGLSTGPHLHFEWRHLTAEGWTAVDAGLHLELALDNLVQRLQTVDNNPEPGRG